MGAGNGNWNGRRSDSPERILVDCTAIIESRDAALKDRVFAYNNRGTAWRLKGDLDLAIADFSESIRCYPQFPAYFNRGTALADKGDLDDAIADFDEAIRLLPQSDINARGQSAIYISRGNA